MKVKSTLRDHYDFWVESGASEFARSVIRNGYIPSLEDMPLSYSETNNKSYGENKEWANEAVGKLVRAGIAVKVDKEDLAFVNPLSVASNSSGKLRLCIDLSRCYNPRSKTHKFKIESTREALQVIGQGDWCFSFDLKSAYLQVPVHESYWKYLGFCVENSEGQKEYF